MEKKKTEAADLENKRGYFFEIGFAVTLLALILIFWWPTKVEKAEELTNQDQNYDDVEEQIVTRQKPVELPPPPPPKETISDVLEVVENDQETNDINTGEEAPEEVPFDPTPAAPIDVPEEEPEQEEQIFTVVEDMPEFPGGDLALRKYIAEHIRYPEMAKENDIQGTVYVKFVVDETGKVTNVSVMRGVDELLDKEAIRVVQSLPKYKPGRQRGKPVKVNHVLPIKFALQN